jgi:hypothetical protein
MMIKKYNFFITALLIWSANLFCAAKDNNERYQVIIENFSTKTNSFNADFINTDLAKDLEIVQEHKKKLEKKVTYLKASWIPTGLNVLGTGFSLNTIAPALHGFGSIVAGLFSESNPVSAFVNQTRWSILRIARPLFNNVEYAGYPVNYVINKLQEPIFNKLSNMESKNVLSKSDSNLAMGAWYTTISLAHAAIAKYLFKKANSYNIEIEKLNKQIATDTAIIKQLESMQQSSNQ